MKTSLFDFKLPESLIAVAPVSPRDAARMLVVADAIQDRIVRELPQLLKPGDVMVFNDTRVIPARLHGKRGEGKVEILLHKRLRDAVWQCFAKPAKRLKENDTIQFADDFFATVSEKLPSGEVVLDFGIPYTALHEKLARYGEMPLPPYIQKQRLNVIVSEAKECSQPQRHPSETKLDRHVANAPRDDESYQTIYAKHEGSVAAPTAGLHFTPELLAAIDAAGVKRAHVTLHVGGGTFLPVKTDDTKDHVMHSEYTMVSEETAALVNQAKARGGRVIAVGTTSLRTLESAARGGKLQAFSGETDIFITPGYRFKLVDMLMTNFHLPCSTLFMLVSAFSGLERMKMAYEHAISQKYRFYSYGDTCFLYKNDA